MTIPVSSGTPGCDIAGITSAWPAQMPRYHSLLWQLGAASGMNPEQGRHFYCPGTEPRDFHHLATPPSPHQPIRKLHQEEKKNLMIFLFLNDGFIQGACPMQLLLQHKGAFCRQPFFKILFSPEQRKRGGENPIKLLEMARRSVV